MPPTQRWAGNTVRTARNNWRPRLPLPCWLCGTPVLPTHAWVVEHITPRSTGGHTTDPRNQWVSHRTCSDRQGGQLGSAKTNAQRRHDNDTRAWW